MPGLLTVLISSATESVHNSNVTQHDIYQASAVGWESTEREWKPRRINLEVQRVQRVAPANVSRDQRRIIHYFCAVNPRVFCCLQKTKLRSGAVLGNRVARRATSLRKSKGWRRVCDFYRLILSLRARKYLRSVFPSNTKSVKNDLFYLFYHLLFTTSKYCYLLPVTINNKLYSILFIRNSRCVRRKHNFRNVMVKILNYSRAINTSCDNNIYRIRSELHLHVKHLESYTNTRFPNGMEQHSRICPHWHDARGYAPICSE